MQYRTDGVVWHRFHRGNNSAPSLCHSPTTGDRTPIERRNCTSPAAGRPGPPGNTGPRPAEWAEFEEQFDKRKVELGNCGRPYATPCEHEHACIRWPLLQVDPAMIDRLDEINTDLIARRELAKTKGWLGELEGIDLTLRFLQDKAQTHTTRPARTDQPRIANHRHLNDSAPEPCPES